jgi:hypothetical protein
VEDGKHTPSMASSGLDFTGTIAVISLGTMGDMSQGVKVNTHAAGAHSFRYTAPAGTVGKGHLNVPFFFEGSCTLLDAEGEWCVKDLSKHTLFFSFSHYPLSSAHRTFCPILSPSPCILPLPPSPCILPLSLPVGDPPPPCSR